MSQLQQRTFCIFIRPCFVRGAVGTGFMPTVTPYRGRIFRTPMPGEETPDGVTIPAGWQGFAIAVELPALNLPMTAPGVSRTGYGIERFNPDTTGRMPDNVDVFSVPPLNENAWYSKDPWLLHSTWTSFAETKHYVRLLVDLLGFSNIMVCGFIPIDKEILPNR